MRGPSRLSPGVSWRTGGRDHDAEVLEAWYRPLLDRSSGTVVGAELVPPARSLRLVRAAAQAFAFGPPADERWSLAVALPPGIVAADPGVGAVAELLRRSGLHPDRLVLQVANTELAHAVRTGAASRLAAMGVRLSVAGFGVHHWSIAAVRHPAVASVEVSLAGLDGSEPADVALLRSVVALAGSCEVQVLGRDIESHQQLVLAGEVGLDLVEGYWWGSPGSLAKLVATWARHPISG
jgi:EAL domain-containing protein (putative c-di-GMP-specific phosphodiesterase class I)